MKKVVSILLILMLSEFCFSARNLSSLIKDLRKNGVDTIISLKVEEGGLWGLEKMKNDTCSPLGYYHGLYINHYVIWKRKGKCYFTKIHPCINYRDMVVDCLPIFLFIDKNISELRREFIYPENYGTDIRAFHEDRISRVVSVYIKNKVLHFNFDQADIEKNYNSKFYKYNQQLKRLEFTKLFIEKLKAVDIGNEHKAGLSLW
jgi:hypothetical protein